MKKITGKKLKRKSLTKKESFKVNVRILKSVDNFNSLPACYVVNLKPKINTETIEKPAKTNFTHIAFRYSYLVFKKSLVFATIVLIVLTSQPALLNAFEAHVINVTADICNSSEIWSMGYWKNHPNIYAHYLPQNLGDEIIDTTEKVEDIFDADDSVMRNKLKKQLLAMKFNIAHFGIGDYFVEDKGQILGQIVSEADDLLSQMPPASEDLSEELEKIKNLFDYLNNIGQIRFCKIDAPDYNYLVINEVYYDVGNRKFCAIDKESEPRNEWIELYNPSENPVDVSGWVIEDNDSSDVIPVSPPIPPYGFAVIAKDATTWQFWSIPSGAIKIELGSLIGNGLNNDGDRVILKNILDAEVDAVSYGADTYAFSPSVPDVLDGHSIARSPKGFDTNKSSDWVDLEMPNPGTNPHYEGHIGTAPCSNGVGGAARINEENTGNASEENTNNRNGEEQNGSVDFDQTASVMPSEPVAGPEQTDESGGDLQQAGDSENEVTNKDVSRDNNDNEKIIINNTEEKTEEIGETGEKEGNDEIIENSGDENNDEKYFIGTEIDLDRIDKNEVVEAEINESEIGAEVDKNEVAGEINGPVKNRENEEIREAETDESDSQKVKENELENDLENESAGNI